jgi:hypothetical protein
MPDGSNLNPIRLSFAPLAERLVETAGAARGKFVVAAYGKHPETGARIAEVRHVENGPNAADAMIAAAATLGATPGANVYVMPALVRPDLPEGLKGGIADVVGMLAVVPDYDRHGGPAIDYASKLPADPHFVVETSPGNFQPWFFFDAPQAPAEVQPILDAFVAESGADPSGAEPSHVFRVPGGLNWPNAAKIREGRPLEPILATVVANALDYEGFTVAELREAIERQWPGTFTRLDQKQEPGAEHVDRAQKVPVPVNTLTEVLGFISPHCDRKTWVRVIGAIRATRLRDVPEEETDDRLVEIATAWSRGEYDREGLGEPANYVDEDDVEATFWTLPPKPGGAAYGTLDALARQNGYDKSPPGTTAAEAFGKVLEQLPCAERETEPAERRVAERLIHFRGRADAMARPKPEMLVETIIPARKLILPYGGTGCGKTYWSLEIATAVAMRRPAFGRFRVKAPGHAGVVVIFAGEDCDYIDNCRLPAIEEYFGRSLEGLVYTTDLAIPITDPNLLSEYRDELRLIQDISGKPIDLVLNDTLTRSLGGLKPNDAETGQQFTQAMEALISEFNTTIICNAHEPKTGGTISGTQVFLNNAPVTPHLERVGKDDTDFQIICEMEPKFRVGPKPKPFTVKGHAVPIPKRVDGIASDLVFKITEPSERAGKSDKEPLRLRVIVALRELTNTSDDYVTVPVVAATLYPKELDEEDKDYRKRLAVAENELRRAIQKRGNTSGTPMGPLSDLVKLTTSGTAYNPYRMFLPDKLRADG